ncbi:MAG: GNAT family N-acetyltransferase [Acidimicrobiales bacterium]|nr:GNAT family N-acetyltransferase [Acidimicrobiales bacterium]
MAYSIAIPAFNEAHTIGRLLESLRSAPEGLVEILVADNASTDRTAAVVNDAARHDARIRLLTVPEAGKPSAWNALLASAREDVIIFIDADAVPEPGSLGALLGALDRAGVIAAGGRRVPRAGGSAGWLARFLSDPVVETCLTGPLYAIRRPAVRARMAELGIDHMPNVFAEDIWLLSLFRAGEFVVGDEATVAVDMDDLAAQRLTSARRRLVKHETTVARADIGRRLDADHPEGLNPAAQLRTVLAGPYGAGRKLRWVVGGAAKLVADRVWPVDAAATGLIDQYSRDPGGLLRGEGSTRARSSVAAHGPDAAVVIRSAVPSDAEAYARLEDEAAGGGTRRLYGRRWPRAVHEAFRSDHGRHSHRHVVCAERAGYVVGIAGLIAHSDWVDEQPPGLRSRVILRWRRRLGFRPTPITLPDEGVGITIAVDERCRGMGIGRRLHHAIVDRAVAAGLSAVVHETAFDNTPALTMNRALGFAELTTRLPEPSALMVRPLTPRAKQRIAWHQDFHGNGFLEEALPLADPDVIDALAADRVHFDRALERSAAEGRAEVPYRFTGAIERAAFDPAVVEVVQAILRTDQWVVWGPNIRRETPNEAHRWHVDLESWYWPSITVAVGVEGCSPEAATVFLPGTARLDRLPSRARQPTDDASVVTLARQQGVTAEPTAIRGLANGRFGVFDAKTWHRGVPEASAGRVLLFLHYQRADARRVPTMVDHHRHQWSTEPAPYRSTTGVNPVVRTANLPAREHLRRLDHRLRR